MPNKEQNKRIVLPVTGMHCASCAANVSRRLSQVDGVAGADVNLAAGKADIIVKDESFSIRKAVEAVEEIGFGIDTSFEKYSIADMSCASCVASIEKTLNRLDGVTFSKVNLADKSLEARYIPTVVSSEEITKLLTDIGYPPQKIDAKTSPDITQRYIDDYKAYKNRFIIAIIGSALVMALSMLKILPETASRWILLFLTASILIVSGRSFYVGGFKSLWRLMPDMNSLIAIGTASAFIYSAVATVFPRAMPTVAELPPVYYESAVMIVALILLGRAIEARMRSRASDAISGLIKLTPKTAKVVRNGRSIEIKTDEIERGDIIRIRSGDRIPTDGVVAGGESWIDESMLTGESQPIKKIPGDPVYGGTINGSGSFEMEASKIGSETMLAGIIRLVEQAQASKASIQRLADKIAGIFVPTIIIIASITFIVWMFAGSDPKLPFALKTFVSVLIIACPCAMGLATPMAIMVASGSAARRGIIFKNAEALETAANLKTVVLDKTGTITRGKPEILRITTTSEFNPSQIMKIAASIESGSDHPLAGSIIQKAEELNQALIPLQSSQTITGKGIKGRFKTTGLYDELKGVLPDTEIFVGSIDLIKEKAKYSDRIENQLNDILSKADASVICIATNTKLLGYIEIADVIRPTSKKAIERLRQMGLQVVMLSGDRELVAKRIAEEVGIDDVISEVLPDRKYNKIKELQGKGGLIGMVGDGINDAPALTQADVGFAIGAGSDIAIESSDVTLIGSELEAVPQAIEISKKTIGTIKQNLFWAFAYNIVLIPIAAGVLYPAAGILLSPVFAAGAMAFSSISVVLNSLKLKK